MYHTYKNTTPTPKIVQELSEVVSLSLEFNVQARSSMDDFLKHVNAKVNHSKLFMGVLNQSFQPDSIKIRRWEKGIHLLSSPQKLQSCMRSSPQLSGAFDATGICTAARLHRIR